MRDVGPGQGGPALLQLEADRPPAEEGRLHERGAGPAHGVEHQVARAGVLGHDAAGQLGQHLGRVGRAGGVVAPGSLVLGRGLGDGPDGKGDGGSGGHGRPTTGGVHTWEIRPEAPLLDKTRRTQGLWAGP